ncbi:MAG: hypothetical protein K9N46_05560 [Candidatus Marinimicrobia bacterium]|nr:hypothetical protein [Candidatus Neomarinimicrobiota bacterium]MCF7880190.1 hypothetical protein [Candidatus Neomarinimicrobiota bacterium]
MINVSSEYHLEPKDIHDIVDSIWEQDIPAARDSEELQWYHNRLSKWWVTNLALAFQAKYGGEKRVCAFYRDRKRKSKPVPNVAEFLFDITIAKYRTFTSSSNRVDFDYILPPIWQIESEFKGDMREISKDFQKLLAGNAPYKMMVGPLRTNQSQAYREDMKHLARYVTAEALYFLFLPHPDSWATQQPEDWLLFLWEDNEWQKVTP